MTLAATDGSGLPEERFATAALERHKREGMVLAVRARWVALAIVAAMLPFLNPRTEILYYEALLGVLALIGWAQLRSARVGRSRAELALLFVDLAVMTVAIAVPNPLATDDWPLAVQFRLHLFMYLYLILACGVLAYSWRTVVAIGTWTAGLWALTVAAAWALSDDHADLTAAVTAAFPGDPRLARLLDPSNLLYFIRVQEAVVFLLVAGTLAVAVRRYGDLLMGHATLERERANLARYFSPNVVEELSQNDEPLKQIRNHDIAVLFVDIVGFTRFAAGRTPEDVITTLRAFHQRMEAEVFRHHGTLDKYLGDGLMATFGTPVTRDDDAANALRCARAMIAAMAAWNAERAAAGEPTIRASFGLHYGPVVLGDIGANRLEFAVIGNTVNVASRIEAMTRPLGCELAASDDLIARVRATADDACATGLARLDDQEIRGLDDRMAVWTLARAG